MKVVRKLHKKKKSKKKSKKKKHWRNREEWKAVNEKATVLSGTRIFE